MPHTLVIEGEPTNDGRELIPGATRWDDEALPLPVWSALGADATMVAAITSIWRDPEDTTRVLCSVVGDVDDQALFVLPRARGTIYQEHTAADAWRAPIVFTRFEIGSAVIVDRADWPWNGRAGGTRTFRVTWADEAVERALRNLKAHEEHYPEVREALYHATRDAMLEVNTLAIAIAAIEAAREVEP